MHQDIMKPSLMCFNLHTTHRGLRVAAIRWISTAIAAIGEVIMAIGVVITAVIGAVIMAGFNTTAFDSRGGTTPQMYNRVASSFGMVIL